MPLTEPGCLYIVATPIGNLDDITHRAVSVLQSVDAIAAEDTRHSRVLLRHLGVDTPLFALHEHNETQASAGIIKRLQAGETIALISDAGTPLVSDPGFVLVREARRAAIRVIPVPGASSILTALSCSGLPTDRFIFEGFLPSKQGTRQNRLKELARDSRTLVFFEAPHRILACLEDMKIVFGAERKAVVAREMTKAHETFLDGSLEDLVEQVKSDSNQSRGEIVLVVEGNIAAPVLNQDNCQLLDVLQEELPLKKAAALAAKITGVSKKIFYQYGLENKDKTSNQ